MVIYTLSTPACYLVTITQLPGPPLREPQVVSHITNTPSLQKPYAIAMHIDHQQALASVPSYATRYGAIFVWHALSAALAWLFITPFVHILTVRQKQHDASRAFRLHRSAMLASVILTVQTFAIGLLFAHDAPRDHFILTCVLMAFCVLQAVTGALRPPPVPEDEKDPFGARHVWFVLHRVCGISVMALAVYVLFHSVRVFDVGSLFRTLADAAVVMVAVLMAACYVYVAVQPDRDEESALGLLDDV